LDADLPAFAARLESEPALAALRASEFGLRLREHASALAGPWLEAAHRGLPAVLWEGAEDEVSILRSRVLRAGVYLHDVRRFLPLEAGAQGVFGALVDVPRGRVVTVVPQVNDCRADFCPNMPGAAVLLTEIGSWQQPPRRWRYGPGGEGGMATELDVRSTPE